MKEKSKSCLREGTTDILTDKDTWKFTIRTELNIPSAWDNVSRRHGTGSPIRTVQCVPWARYWEFRPYGTMCSMRSELNVPWARYMQYRTYGYFAVLGGMSLNVLYISI